MNNIDIIEIKNIINEIKEEIIQNYVFSDKVEEVTSKLKEKLESGNYYQLEDFNLLANSLTDDLQVFAKDYHFFCEYNPKKASNPQFFTDWDRCLSVE